MFNPEIPASRRDGILGKRCLAIFWQDQWQVALLRGRPKLTEPTSSRPLAPGPSAGQFFPVESAILGCGIQRGLPLARSHAGCGDER
jgi:hypothetical protein